MTVIYSKGYFRQQGQSGYNGSQYDNTWESSNLPIGLEIDEKLGTSRPKPTTEFIPPTAYSRDIATGNPYGFRDVFLTSRGTNCTWGGYENGYRWGALPLDSDMRLDPTRPQCPSYVSDGAANKALAALKGQRVNFAQAFGERRQTANLVANSIMRITKAVGAAKRLDPRGIQKALGVQARKGIKRNTKDAAGLWLEHQYGWLPLLSDVHGATELLNERDGDDPYRYTVSVTGKYQDHIVTPPLTKLLRADGNIGTHVTFSVTKEYAQFYKAKCRIDAYADNPELGLATSLGLTNPLDVAWELTPFSFVVDWFLPVGNYLNLLDATSGFKFRSGSLTTTAEYLGSLDLTDTNCQPGWCERSGTGTSHSNYRRFYMNRMLYSDFPTGSLHLSNDPFRGNRVYNALALLRLQFKK